MDDPIKTKICPKCPEKGPQPLSHFSKATTRKDGHQRICKTCRHNSYAATRPPKPEMPPGHKVCKQCPEKGPQPFSAFSKRATVKDGRLAVCKACHKKAYEANRDSILAQQAGYYADNREVLAQKRAMHPEVYAVRWARYYAANRTELIVKTQTYYAANREEILDKASKYRIANLDKIKAREARYYKAHPEHAKEAAARRYARQQAAPNIEKIDRQAIYERDQWVCQLCHTKVFPKYKSPHPQSPSLDHVIALSEGGDHTMQNQVLVHRGCNSRKGNRHKIPQQQRLFG